MVHSFHHKDRSILFPDLCSRNGDFWERLLSLNAHHVSLFYVVLFYSLFYIHVVEEHFWLLFSPFLIGFWLFEKEKKFWIGHTLFIHHKILLSPFVYLFTRYTRDYVCVIVSQVARVFFSS